MVTVAIRGTCENGSKKTNNAPQAVGTIVPLSSSSHEHLPDADAIFGVSIPPRACVKLSALGELLFEN